MQQQLPQPKMQEYITYFIVISDSWLTAIGQRDAGGGGGDDNSTINLQHNICEIHLLSVGKTVDGAHIICSTTHYYITSNEGAGVEPDAKRECLPYSVPPNNIQQYECIAYTNTVYNQVSTGNWL